MTVSNMPNSFAAKGLQSKMFQQPSSAWAFASDCSGDALPTPQSAMIIYLANTIMAKQSRIPFSISSFDGVYFPMESNHA